MSAADDAVRRSAKQWLEQHGDAAVTKARDMVAVMQAASEAEAADAWLRIIVAIEEQRRRREPR